MYRIIIFCTVIISCLLLLLVSLIHFLIRLWIISSPMLYHTAGVLVLPFPIGHTFRLGLDEDFELAIPIEKISYL